MSSWVPREENDNPNSPLPSWVQYESEVQRCAAVLQEHKDLRMSVITAQWDVHFICSQIRFDAINKINIFSPSSLVTNTRKVQKFSIKMPIELCMLTNRVSKLRPELYERVNTALKCCNLKLLSIDKDGIVRYQIV